MFALPASKRGIIDEGYLPSWLDLLRGKLLNQKGQCSSQSTEDQMVLYIAI